MRTHGEGEAMRRTHEEGVKRGGRDRAGKAMRRTHGAGVERGGRDRAGKAMRRTHEEGMQRGGRDRAEGAIGTTWSLRVVLGLVAALAALALGPSRAVGASGSATAAPHWSVIGFAAPTNFKPGDTADYYTLAIRNDGAAPTDGSAITIADTLPPNLTPTKMEGAAYSLSQHLGDLTCEVKTLTCTYEHSLLGGAPLIEPDETIWVRIVVSVAPGAFCATPAECENKATVSGGGAPSRSIASPTMISSEQAPFGFSSFGVDLVNAAGEPDTQAGSHPFELTTSLSLNLAALDTEEGLYHNSPILSAAAKDINVELPPGLVGDPNAVPRCRQSVFQSNSGVRCPADTQVGTITFDTAGQAVENAPNQDAATSAVYNVEPPSGQPAELGFELNTIKVHTLFHVRGDGSGDYGLTAQTPEITQFKPLLVAMLTVWGVPADPSHDNERSGALRPGGGEECTHPIEVKKFEEEIKALEAEKGAKEAEITLKEEQIREAEEKKEAKRVKALEGEKLVLEKERAEVEQRLAEREHSGPSSQSGCSSDVAAKPFLRTPTNCQAGGPGDELRAQADSWAEPGRFINPPNLVLGPFEGCPDLSFEPSIAVEPERHEPTTPSGYAVRLNVPQNEAPGARGTPDLKTATIALPPGTVASPSAADGLQACGEAQFARLSDAPASCPGPSQLGTVTVHSPLLPSPGLLDGQLYLGQPECAPCSPADAQAGRMIPLFLQARGFGVTVKLAGHTSLDTSTGQLTTTFANDPQLPFDELTISVHGGPRAPLANPGSCGAFTAASALEPWSAPFTATAAPTGTFAIDGCGPPRFAPSFEAGPVNDQAGAFSPFTLTFSRADADLALGTVTVRMPPGLLGMLSRVQLCPEPQAGNGTCGPQSEIGTTTVASGPGPSPFYLAGKVYLTGPYRGAPFGLSIVVPVVAGPFNLGDVVVRSAIQVDPHTAAITVASDPLPSVIDGVPAQIKAVNVNIDRAGFTFNPTNCAASKIEGTLTAAQGTSAPVASNFEAANCASLKFNPLFTVSTSGRTSKAGGASLDVKVAQQPGEANIHKVDVSLPLALPARLTTLQKACTEAQFDANPAGCPAASNVGTAVARTPVLNGPLTGPAYLVSHGGAAFPDLVIVLQGEGIRIDLVGNTDIKKGITYSKFETVPDAPISTFELSLPEGPHSALAANANLCALKSVKVKRRVTIRRNGRIRHVLRAVRKLVRETLQMPTTITGQNGAVVNQTTKIAVTGCPHKPKHHAHRPAQHGPAHREARPKR
jgi:uncharacterized repeat protein (TIGR01451 family)